MPLTRGPGTASSRCVRLASSCCDPLRRQPLCSRTMGGPRPAAPAPKAQPPVRRYQTPMPPRRPHLQGRPVLLVGTRLWRMARSCLSREGTRVISSLSTWSAMGSSMHWCPWRRSRTLQLVVARCKCRLHWRILHRLLASYTAARSVQSLIVGLALDQRLSCCTTHSLRLGHHRRGRRSCHRDRHLQGVTRLWVLGDLDGSIAGSVRLELG
mmetsp:Transcript_52452/g.145412  ORF Transcript_52452/g.145412 Transcript_52452/m.145412 type:complete len:211 (+) Transcript_52452:463-1095(+)